MRNAVSIKDDLLKFEDEARWNPIYCTQYITITCFWKFVVPIATVITVHFFRFFCDAHKTQY